ncbi:hypothetical protein GRAN_4882 [Granulicella sibirica]|uniref:Uncharacterized protein n=1 Tax=Granulicella sibirica TaxID=2479048 RepID=A0A4Q0SYG1_9BACT|nr:hypothetical protein GRAN_4882 [Granulicella sibirica]
MLLLAAFPDAKMPPQLRYTTTLTRLVARKVLPQDGKTSKLL